MFICYVWRLLFFIMMYSWTSIIILVSIIITIFIINIINRQIMNIEMCLFNITGSYGLCRNLIKSFSNFFMKFVYFCLYILHSIFSNIRNRHSIRWTVVRSIISFIITNFFSSWYILTFFFKYLAMSSISFIWIYCTPISRLLINMIGFL